MIELRRAYAGRRVLITGHTGFKGSWLTLWLEHLGAEVIGYALPPETKPSLFACADVGRGCRHIEADVRDRSTLRSVLSETRPEFVFHLAAQSLVRRSYREPVPTIETNVMGTTNLLEAIRLEARPCVVVVVTSDKCYQNHEQSDGYREIDPMGGSDVYSMSKGATELVVDSYRHSFFPPERLSEHGTAIATGRAGNCIGGGDWSEDRLVPDCIRALVAGEPIPVRNPASIRPWQHVLEPLGGYLTLGAAMTRPGICGPWNFGPAAEDDLSVRALVELLISEWGGGAWVDRSDPSAPHEAGRLRLSIEKARTRLGWSPRWRVREAVRRTIQWHRIHAAGASSSEFRVLMLGQIDDYMSGTT